MLNQALEVFKKEYEEKGDSLILDRYIPDSGTYVVVKPTNNSFIVDEIVEIKFDKKTKKTNINDNRYKEFICFADYYSKVTSTNKTIYAKSIHSNNYLSFIIKKETLRKNKLKEEVIDKYYRCLENPKERYDKDTLELYELVEKEIGQVNKERLNKIKKWLKNNIAKLVNDINGNDYLKFFFYYPKEDYEKESKRYNTVKLFNANKHNITMNNEIYGLPSDNISLNCKKPFYEHTTRKVSVPYLISLKEVVLQKKFFDHLMNCAKVGKKYIYINKKITEIDGNTFLSTPFNGQFFKVEITTKKQGKFIQIQDYDIVINYNNTMQKTFNYNNILGMNYNNLNAEYGKIHTLSKMQELINEVMFSKCLTTNYFTEPKDIKIHDNILKYNILTCRNALFNWFYKGKYNNIWILLNKASLSLIKGSICNENIRRARDQFNLWFSMKEYFEGGEDMADIIFSLKENLRSKVSKKSTSYIESDEEYLFAVGQLVNFFISKSKGKKKPLSLANPFVNAKNDKVIKNKLKALYKKYNYDIDNYEIRFKTLYAMVMSYELEGKVNDDMIIAGFLHSNLLYEKENKGEVSNE
jgi:CRISPR-associated protein Csh1